MNKRRNIYRGMNKRKGQASGMIALLITSMVMVGGYKLYQKYDESILKHVDFSSITDKLKFKNNSNIFTSKDLEKEIENLKKGNEEVDTSTKKETSTKDEKSQAENANLATINGWNIYSIQIAVISSENQLEELQTKLLEKNIPFSILKNKDVSKIHTQSYIKEEDTRAKLEEIKSEFPDAFFTKLEIPVVSFEYTKKYDYVNDIAKELNKLIVTFETESKFWANQKDDVDYSEYTKIINERKTIQSNISKYNKKINYEKLQPLKESLDIYIKSLDNNIDACEKASKANNRLVCQSLYISSMQGYYNFIESIR